MTYDELRLTVREVTGQQCVVAQAGPGELVIVTPKPMSDVQRLALATMLPIVSRATFAHEEPKFDGGHVNASFWLGLALGALVTWVALLMWWAP